MKHELRRTERQGSGAIVNNASVGALTGNPGINAMNSGIIDTQIARNVVNGDEQAYAEPLGTSPRSNKTRPERSLYPLPVTPRGRAPPARRATTSWRPSASSWKASTTRKIAAPDATEIHGASRRYE